MAYPKLSLALAKVSRYNNIIYHITVDFSLLFHEHKIGKLNRPIKIADVIGYGDFDWSVWFPVLCSLDKQSEIDSMVDCRNQTVPQ